MKSFLKTIIYGLKLFLAYFLFIFCLYYGKEFIISLILKTIHSLEIKKTNTLNYKAKILVYL